jgi:hypothetical protein
VLFDLLQPDPIEVVDGGGEVDRAGDVRRARLEPVRQLAD